MTFEGFDVGDTQRKLRPTSNVEFTIVDGEAVLADVEAGDLLGLNKLASEIWELICAGISLEEIAQRLEHKYDVSNATLMADIFELVGALVDRNLLEYT